MIEAPGIIRTEPIHFGSLRLEIPGSEMSKAMGPGIAEVLAALKDQGVTPSGAWFTHHFRRPTDSFDFEICMPVDAPIVAAGRVQPGIWPAMTVARTVYHGNYAQLPHAWGEFEGWMKAESHAGGTEFWERYLVDPNTEPNPDNWRTELNWPLAVQA